MAAKRAKRKVATRIVKHKIRMLELSLDAPAGSSFRAADFISWGFLASQLNDPLQSPGLEVSLDSLQL